MGSGTSKANENVFFDANVLASKLGWYSISSIISRILSRVAFETSPRLWITRSTVPIETFAFCAISFIRVWLIALIMIRFNDEIVAQEQSYIIFHWCRVRTRKKYSITFLTIFSLSSLQIKDIVHTFVSAHGIVIVLFICQ